MKRLQVLILSNNVIEKIEKLDKLLKLKELDLSNNCIVKIEGLENLTNLQILNLSGNLIEHIPIWMGKRLKSLRAFHVGKNRLESLSELAKLKPLPDLTQLTVAENPLAEFNHCRPYLVFHLRTVEVTDGQAVTERERVAAMDRFEQDEVERLEKQLENEEAKCRRLEEDHNRSKQERSHLSATEDDLRKREKLQNSRIEELERELETKNDLLKKKTSELNKACEKHYQLEQELAFHKIDSKFDSLGRGPEQSYDDNSTVQSTGTTGSTRTTSSSKQPSTNEPSTGSTRTSSTNEPITRTSSSSNEPSTNEPSTSDRSPSTFFSASTFFSTTVPLTVATVAALILAVILIVLYRQGRINLRRLQFMGLRADFTPSTPLRRTSSLPSLTLSSVVSSTPQSSTRQSSTTTGWSLRQTRLH